MQSRRPAAGRNSCILLDMVGESFLGGPGSFPPSCGNSSQLYVENHLLVNTLRELLRLKDSNKGILSSLSCSAGTLFEKTAR